MIDEFDHERLRVYHAAIAFVAWVEETCKAKGASAREHLERASTSVPVNIAEATGTFSANARKQSIETAYGSCLECAACLDVLGVYAHLNAFHVRQGKQELSNTVGMLIGFRKATERMVREQRETYGNISGRADEGVLFDHERLDVYRKALSIVKWCVELDRRGNLARTTMVALDRATTGIVLNIAEGNGKFSLRDRCRFITHARTSALQAAATLDVLAVRHEKSSAETASGKQELVEVVRMLVAWRRSLTNRG